VYLAVLLHAGFIKRMDAGQMGRNSLAVYTNWV